MLMFYFCIAQKSFLGASGLFVCVIEKPRDFGFQNGWIQRLKSYHQNSISPPPFLISAFL